jgi:hypothetical protein
MKTLIFRFVLQDIKHILFPFWSQLADTYAAFSKILVKSPFALNSPEAADSIQKIKCKSVAQLPYPISYD